MAYGYPEIPPPLVEGGIPIAISIPKKTNPNKRMHWTLIFRAGDPNRYDDIRLPKEGGTMRDWNVIVTVAERGFARAFESLEKMGQVGKTDYYNVLMMKVDDIHSLMEKLWELSSEDPNALSYLTRLVPVTHSFTFKSAEEFKEKAKEIALSYARELAGKSFHVRMHRRGFKGRLSSVDEEKFLDDVLLEALDRAGSPGHITFENPDAIVAVETVGTQAGLSLWSREDLRLYPFLRLD